MAQPPKLSSETAAAHGGGCRHAITPFRILSKLLGHNYLRLVGKILQDNSQRVFADVHAFSPLPGGERPSHGTPSDARWVVHTQGHAQAMISARPSATAAFSLVSAASGMAASPPATRSLRRTFRGEPGQVPLARDFVFRCLDGRHCPEEAVQDILVCATELAANAVLHSHSGLPRGHFSVEVVCAGQSVRVAVEDSGGPWVERGNGDTDAECGRGLHVVSALSAEMGITGDASGRMAWFCCRWSTTPDKGR
jgi:anti-sigma regulatory factor (Ser/Thr protein kinase)